MMRPQLAALPLLIVLADAQASPLDDVRGDLESGQWRRAEIALKGQIQQYPEEPAAYRLLARLYLLRHDGAAAQHELESAASLEPPTPQDQIHLGLALLYQGQSQGVLDRIQVPPESPPTLRADLLALRGLAQGALNDLSGAETSLREALVLDPNSVRAHLGLARLALAERDIDAARAKTEKALELDEKALDGWELLADLEIAAGAPEAAAEALGQLLRRAPEHWPARQRRVHLQLDLNDPEGAAQDIQILADQIPGAAILGLLRGRLALARGDYQAGAEQIERYLNSNPKDPLALYLAGATAHRLGHQAQAEGYAERLASVAPGNPQAATLMAAIRLAKDDIAGADALLNTLPRTADASPASELRLRSALAKKDLETAQALLSQRVATGHAAWRDRLRLLHLLAARGDWAAVKREAPALLAEQSKRPQDRSPPQPAQGQVEPPQASADRERSAISALLIEALLQTGDTQGALTQAQAQVQAYPQESTAHQALGAVLGRGGDTDGARAAFREALRLDPANGNAALNLARLETASGDLAAARASFDQLAAAAPASPLAVLGLAALDIKEGRPADSEARLAKAIDQSPGNTGLRLNLAAGVARRGDPQGALRVLQEAPADQAEVPALLLQRGELELMTGQPTLATATFERLRTLQPGNPALALLLARARAESGQFMDLEPLVVEGLGVEGKPDLIQSSLVAIYKRLPDLAARERLLAAIAGQSPQDPTYRTLAAQLAVEKKDPEAAIAHLRAAHAAAPDQSGIFRSLIALLNAEGETGDARTLAQGWVARHPKEIDGRLALAGLDLRLGETDQAIAQYREILTLDPKQVVALNNLAMLTLDQDTDAALTLARQAVALMPADWRMADTLATILLRQGQAAEVVALLAPLSAKEPGNPTLTYRLATALAQSGEGEKARRLLLELGPVPFEERAAADSLVAELTAAAEQPHGNAD